MEKRFVPAPELPFGANNLPIKTEEVVKTPEKDAQIPKGALTPEEIEDLYKDTKEEKRDWGNR